MKAYRILAFVAALSVAGVSVGQVSFDFEGVVLQDLIDAGWIFIDDRGMDVGGVPTQYLDTIVIETTIVHSGSQALRLGVRDIGYFALNGEFGTLELWSYDPGHVIGPILGNGAGATSADGPRFGLQKYMDFDTSVYFPVEEPVDHGILNRPYGIGAGLIHRSWLSSDEGYGAEWGNTPHLDLAVISQVGQDYDPAAPAVNSGFAGDQTWFSANWFGTMPNGRPDSLAMESGWNHWRIAYTAPGVVEITMLESWAGDSHTATGTPVNAFDGATPGGVSDMFLYGGRTLAPGAEPDTWFGDGIFDDITWTPAGPTLQADFDDDGDVDLDDFVVLKSNFGTGTTHAQGDADLDGDVDLDDFVILKQEFGS